SLGRLRVQVEDLDGVFLDAVDPGVEPALESFSEEPLVEQAHVEGELRLRKKPIEARYDLDCAAPIEQRLDRSGRVARAVVVEHDDVSARGPLVEQHLPGGQHIRAVDAGHAINEGNDGGNARAG